MQNKMLRFVRRENLLRPGDTLICAVSGGADSVALLFACYLLKEQLGVTLEAAHFNHHLRGEESLRDEQFVRELCQRFEIPLHVGQARVTAGKKGLEAAARDARYAFLRDLPGKVATAHTADDNAETVLMRLIRGTGLKGLGAIAPVSGNVIRPMLMITRQEVEEFLEEWSLPHIEDSSNESDAFLRNRIRRQIMPLFREENPKIGENLSRMALRLRDDSEFLEACGDREGFPGVQALKAMHPALRRRCLERFLKENGVKEPEDVHISLTEGLLCAASPSARANLPGGITVWRNYDRLEVLPPARELEKVTLSCPGQVELPGYRVRAFPAEGIVNNETTFTVEPRGTMFLRSRQSGDSIRLSGGTKSLKKLFIDRKIPASQRPGIPVLCDDAGVLAVYSIGVHRDRAASAGSAVTVCIEKICE